MSVIINAEINYNCYRYNEVFNKPQWWKLAWVTANACPPLLLSLITYYFTSQFCYPHKKIYVQHRTLDIIITIMVHFMSHQTDVSVELFPFTVNYNSTSKTLRICNSTLNAHISLPLSQKCDMLCTRDIAMGRSRGMSGRFSVYPWFNMGTKYDYCRQRNWQWKFGLFNSIQIVIQF